jgi:excisionase family DNA binding protein
LKIPPSFRSSARSFSSQRYVQWVTDLELELAAYTYERCAELLGVCRETIERLARRGRLPVTYITPDAPRIRHLDLVEYLASVRKKATSTQTRRRPKTLPVQRRAAVVGPRPG